MPKLFQSSVYYSFKLYALKIGIIMLELTGFSFKQTKKVLEILSLGRE